MDRRHGGTNCRRLRHIAMVPDDPERNPRGLESTGESHPPIDRPPLERLITEDVPSPARCEQHDSRDALARIRWFV